MEIAIDCDSFGYELVNIKEHPHQNQDAIRIFALKTICKLKGSDQ